MTFWITLLVIGIGMIASNVPIWGTIICLVSSAVIFARIVFEIVLELKSNSKKD